MRSTTIALLSVLGLSSAFAVPVIHQRDESKPPQISCNTDNESKGQIYQGDYIYGGGGQTKLGYKSYTDASTGKESLKVVSYNANDPTIRLLDSVISLQCNSTALGLSYVPGKFGVDQPVKLLSDVGRDGVPYCIGLEDPSGNPSDIALVPCSNVDTVEAQQNQFWNQVFKYVNLMPYARNSTASNPQPLLARNATENDANSDKVWTTEPYQCSGSCSSETKYASFTLDYQYLTPGQ